MSQGTNRRNVLKSVAALVGLGGCYHMKDDGPQQFVGAVGESSEGVDLSELDMLEIPTEVIHTVETGVAESYEGIDWDSGGYLELETDSELEIKAV